MSLRFELTQPRVHSQNCAAERKGAVLPRMRGEAGNTVVGSSFVVREIVQALGNRAEKTRQIDHQRHEERQNRDGEMDFPLAVPQKNRGWIR